MSWTFYTANGAEKLLPSTALIPRARVFKSANGSVSGGSVLQGPVSWDSESFDTDGLHDNVTNNGRLTIRTAGIYRVTAQIDFQTGASAGIFYVLIFKNGGNVTSTRGPIGASSAGSVVATDLIECAVGDYLEVYVENTSANTTTLTSGIASYFEAIKIDPTINYVGLVTQPALYQIWDSSDAGVGFPTASIGPISIPQTYKHLVIESVVLLSAGSANLGARFNGDAGANYVYTLLQTASATVSGSSSSTDHAPIGLGASASSIPAWNTARIPDYRNGLQKGTIADIGSDTIARLITCRWTGTAPITTITFFTPINTFVAGSRITIYGEA